MEVRFAPTNKYARRGSQRSHLPGPNLIFGGPSYSISSQCSQADSCHPGIFSICTWLPKKADCPKNLSSLPSWALTMFWSQFSLLSCSCTLIVTSISHIYLVPVHFFHWDNHLFSLKLILYQISGALSWVKSPLLHSGRTGRWTGSLIFKPNIFKHMLAG